VTDCEPDGAILNGVSTLTIWLATPGNWLDPFPGDVAVRTASAAVGAPIEATAVGCSGVEPDAAGDVEAVEAGVGGPATEVVELGAAEAELMAPVSAVEPRESWRPPGCGSPVLEPAPLWPATPVEPVLDAPLAAGDAFESACAPVASTVDPAP